jgi:hypothetical protein
VLVELSVMEQTYQAMLAVVQDGWKVGAGAAHAAVADGRDGRRAAQRCSIGTVPSEPGNTILGGLGHADVETEQGYFSGPYLPGVAGTPASLPTYYLERLACRFSAHGDQTARAVGHSASRSRPTGDRVRGLRGVPLRSHRSRELCSRGASGQSRARRGDAPSLPPLTKGRIHRFRLSFSDRG